MSVSDPRDINIDAFDYPLPEERIAKHPLEKRDSCRLLVFNVGDARASDHIFKDLPELLPKGAMLVYNNTRVINARLRFHKATGALIEIFCLEPFSPADYEQNFASRDECVWECLVGNSKRWKAGPLTMTTCVAGSDITVSAYRVGAGTTANAQLIRFCWDRPEVTFSDIIAAIGEIPIPPYLNRSSEDVDATDYQTVYSHIEGSVAAPTAGLHFTPELLEAIDGRGVLRREVTLHVGAGTFRPVKTDSIGEHEMHSEFITVSRDFISELSDVVGQQPIVAVGTTTVRTLESLYHIGALIISGRWDGELPQWTPYEKSEAADPSEALKAIVHFLDRQGEDFLMARTRIIIAPGYTYRLVDAMITNFHQPRSTLLLLVSAFIGDSWRHLYDHALDSGYRFLSYGDACLFGRRKPEF